MRRYITSQDTGKRYLIRGPWKAEEIKRQYASVIAKYETSLGFDRWLVEYGKVYFEIKKAGKE